MTRPEALIFDVNETMLDLTAMRPVFASEVGDETLLPTWFGLLLRYSLEVTVLNNYMPFDQLARNALVVVAEQAGRSVTDSAIETVVAAMKNLPAHPDVPPAVERLAEAGFKMATLSNSGHDTVTAQLTNAGIIQHFNWVISVDMVETYKPDHRTYQWAATARLGTSFADTMLIAAHDWDVNGAHLAGLQAAFVERPSSTRAPHAHLPELRHPSMTGIADALLEMKQ